MDIEKVKQAQTQEEARQFAMDWQNWIYTDALGDNRGFSYGEIAEWMLVFEILAVKFGLVEEFTENGII